MQLTTTNQQLPTIVGIDLGTTNSLAAYVRDGRPEAVRDGTGTALVPSCVSFHPDGTVSVGAEARARALSDPAHTVFSVKRLMGRTLAELQAELPFVPHQLGERDVGGRKVLFVRVGDRELTPEELSAMILREVRTRAGDPTKAVVTVPAYFDDAQRQATRDAGRIAGLDVLRIVNEPTAAALAYGLDRRNAGVVAVYDLGGGTFDCSILRLSAGVFQVLSTQGDTHLGGDDFDQSLMRTLAAGWGFDLDAGRDPELLQRLRDAAERAKIALSDAESAAVTLDMPGRDTPPRTVTRGEFEAMIAPDIERTLSRCRSALSDARLAAADVAEVVLVGGSTRIPYVRRRVKELFGREPHSDLNPDEVVALGAAVQADILAGRERSVLLLDVVPLSLGVETLGGVVDKVIHRNSTVPCRAVSRYSTAKDGQGAIRFAIYQGERELVQDCRKLAEFVLRGIPPMAAQLPQVDVTFMVDANGMLTVSAKEQRSGTEATVEVLPQHGLSQDEVEALVLESVEHAHADFTARGRIELGQKAVADLAAARKALANVGAELPAADRLAVEAGMAELTAAVEAGDVPQLKRALDAFNAADAIQTLAELNMSGVTRDLFAGKRESDLDRLPGDPEK